MNSRPIEAEISAFLSEHEARLAPLLRESHLAAWDAATGGGKAATERSARARAAVRRLYTDAGEAARVRDWLASPEVADPLLRRQLTLLDHEYTGNQLPAETIEDLSRRGADLERIFQTFRAELDGAQVTNNRLRDILRDERDPALRRAAWEASKQVAREVAEPLRELVRRRNEAARELGFENYYRMELTLQELEEETLFRLLDDFARRSEEPFRRLRAEVDGALAARHSIPVAELRPWHWEDFFGQIAPSAGGVSMDPVYAGVDLEEVASRFFEGIGMPVEDVIARSDLYERPGKDQHAFCIDIDRAGDVRMLCNLRQDEKWMGTLLHELGHAVYDKYLPSSLPFLLRSPAHTLSTEAIAMYMGRLTGDPAWVRDALGVELPPEESAAVRRQLRAAMLIATRWMLVMAYFERELYRDPDREDLGEVWWELVERYQLIRRPEQRDAPDWAAKIHLSGAPVYYHNYLLGELMTSQLTERIRTEVLRGADSVVGRPDLGAYLRDEIFARGATLDWNDLLVAATGEPLSAEYFVRQFVDG